MKHILIIILLSTFSTLMTSQSSDEDALYLKRIYDFSLTKSECYDNLRHLCKNIGNRQSGDEGYERATKYCQTKLIEMKVDKAYLQPCTVKVWNRGTNESFNITTDNGDKIRLNMLSLGGSVGTPTEGIEGDIVEVKSLDEVRALGIEGIEGKIVFYNRPMDPTQTNTFRAYGGAVDQRVYGATTAAEFGALASITRSMTVNKDDWPHTGTLFYREDFPTIPGVAISTNDADILSQKLKSGNVTGYLMTQSKPNGETTNHTVIGEIIGSEFPEEIILVGGHLDSWDVGEGAHDDGTGVVQSMQVLHTLINLGYKPKRTIRCVLFANEESGLAGGTEYAKVSNKKNEYHLAALESDSGGFTPKGLNFEGDESTFKQHYQSVSKWTDLFEAYGILFGNGGSGADIGPLKGQKGLLIGLKPDTQRYFDYHHTDADVFEAVNKRELELGAAAMTSMVYLIDKYGL